MAKFIGSSDIENFGEKLFIDKAQEYLDDTHIIYWNRQVYGREFDVCILMPGKGILVVELKGWREESILRVENNVYYISQIRLFCSPEHILVKRIAFKNAGS